MSVKAVAMVGGVVVAKEPAVVEELVAAMETLAVGEPVAGR